MEQVIRDLDPIEQRVLGALLEKSQATPDYYPLTVNAVIAACNQKSNRDPVTAYTEAEVRDTLERLRADVLAWRSESARSVRWSESITRRLGLDDAQRALLTLLLLRGPQTPGELRSRSGRLHTFESLSQIDETLRSMTTGDDPMVAELERSPGQKERRWVHLLGDTPPPTTAQAPAVVQDAAVPMGGSFEHRLEQLERTVAELTERIVALEPSIDRSDDTGGGDGPRGPAGEV